VAGQARKHTHDRHARTAAGAVQFVSTSDVHGSSVTLALGAVTAAVARKAAANTDSARDIKMSVRERGQEDDPVAGPHHTVGVMPMSQAWKIGTQAGSLPVSVAAAEVAAR